MTYTADLAASAALLNDQSQEKFTNTVMLPYLNIARNELQEMFELNNIPVTKKTSAIIVVPAGTVEVIITPAIPAPPIPYYPSDLIEIERLWESSTGQNNWIPVTKKDYLTQSSLANTQLSIFGVWAWIDQKIQVLAANTAIDLKIDYIKSLFLTLAIGDVSGTNSIMNTDTFLQYRVAGLVSEFIDENIQRANSLNSLSLMALERSLGISTKGRQSIVTGRKPFRSSWKRRGILVG